MRPTSTRACSSVDDPATTFVTPGWDFGIAKNFASAGRRRSRSTRATLCPARASATARLATVVDLPSCSSALVTRIERAPRSRFTNWRLARSMRNASASSACRAGDHHQLVVAAKLLRRRLDPSEKRRPEPVADFRRGAQARIEGVAGEGKPDAQHETEHHAENGGALSARLDLRSAVRGTKERGVRGLQRLHGAQLLLVLDQPREQSRALEPRLLELVDPAAKLLAGSDKRCSVELAPVRDELLACSVASRAAVSLSP